MKTLIETNVAGIGPHLGISEFRQTETACEIGLLTFDDICSMAYILLLNPLLTWQ